MDDDQFEEFGMERRPPCQLYVISPPQIEVATHAAQLREIISAGPVAAYQLRLKGVSDADILAAAKVLQPICDEAGVAFILNDRPDLAKQCNAHGVHLGQEDGLPEEARKLLGKDAQIGVTCHDSHHFAMEAGEAGADYVAFGAFFPTSTKKTEYRADTDILKWWTSISPIPCVAIGGITPENCREIVRAGADFIAVSSAIWEGGPAAVQAFAAVIDEVEAELRAEYGTDIAPKKG